MLPFESHNAMSVSYVMQPSLLSHARLCFLGIGFSRSSAPRMLVVSLLVNDVYFRGPDRFRELLSTRKSNACGCHWHGGILTGISRKFRMPMSNVPRHLSAGPIHPYRTLKPTRCIALSSLGWHTHQELLISFCQRITILLASRQCQGYKLTQEMLVTTKESVMGQPNRSRRIVRGPWGSLGS
jgi:hypothetical protein